MKKLHISILFSFLTGLVICQQKPSILRRNQRYPNDDESNICSRIRDVIPRNSGRFRKILIRNTKNDVIFVNEDCRRMTARCKSKLDAVISLAKREWSALKIRVLKAWTDRVDINDPISLHYEGRSLRLQTSDRDPNKLGQLAGIALEAGFDWVKYSSNGYIRASVIPDVCQTSVDLVFLLDGSGSVRRKNFLKVKDFVKKVLDFFNIGVTGTHVAVVKYSTNIKTEFPLNRYYTKSDMKRAVDRISYERGLTFTGEALNHLRHHIFTKSAGMRADVGIPKVLVLLTDGYSNGISVGPPAQKLKNLGISIFSIGVGHRFSLSELKEISSDPDSDYVFKRTFDNLIASWVDQLSSVSCSEASLIDSCKNSETSVESGSFKYFRTQFHYVTGSTISVELRDVVGVSHLYASKSSKNPGPLDPASIKNEDKKSPRAVSVSVDSSKTVFVAVQGQRNKNTFTLSFWDNLFKEVTYNVKIAENEPAKMISSLGLSTSRYKLKFKISDGNTGNAFRIDSNVPKLYTTKALDRESISMYSLIVVAENERNKCHKSRTNIIVNVLDKNDHAPKFTRSLYTLSVLENTAVNTVLTTVQATDKDSGQNGQITYTITSQDSLNKFRINKRGEVVLKGQLDYESTQRYTIHLEARDGKGLKDSSRLVVTVLNVNEAPTLRCNNVNCEYTVNENVPLGTKFAAQMLGSDPDSRTSCKLKYSVQSTVKNKFNIQSDGVLKTNGPLDRELQPIYRFYVTVTDCGGLTDSVHVTVTLTDVNDNAPYFSGNYLVNILESEQPGSNVLQVTAKDADEGANARIMYSLSGPESTAFLISSSDGKITTRSSLDFEKKQSYQFRVIALDGGQNVQRGTSRVTVNVVDVNDNEPVFGGPYTVHVSEDVARGNNVITVKATDKDSGKRGKVHYSIIAGNKDNAFAIDSISGSISVSSVLDRETKALYKLVIQASDQGSPSLNSRVNVVITIDDVNDNRPVFQGEPFKRSVPENYSLTNVLLQVIAVDADAGYNGTVVYSIKSSTAANTFSIDGNNGEIKLKKSLDYEVTKDYSFTVTATDGGGRKTETNIQITVEDVNDNKPIFQNAPYNASVLENANIGHVIGTVIATDLDTGPRGRVSYSIASGNTGNAFRISAVGNVVVASNLDYETKSIYVITIKAQDDGKDPKSSTTQFKIDVTDINDNAPRFQQNLFSFKIAENNIVNTVVGTIDEAKDADSGSNGEIDYFIVSGNTDRTFVLRNRDLFANKSLDREQKDFYSLIIEAKDRGQPSLSTRVSVEVLILDTNDNAPIFTRDNYSCVIDENAAEGLHVCAVRATDDDIGNNGTIAYELVTSSDEFALSQESGEIKSEISFDREKKPSYTLQVHAKDLGNPQMSSTAMVTIKITDVNDNAPKFDKDYMFAVSEDASRNEKVGKINASDVDEGQSGSVAYTIIQGNINSSFAVDENTGELTVQSSLDREMLSSFKLTVSASDQGNPTLSSRKVIPVKILDVNDNSPKFTFTTYVGSIAEDAANQSRVVQVKANDADDGMNGQIKYAISSGIKKEHFAIDSDSGLITSASKLDYETKKSYNLTVTATDQGTPSRSTTCFVNIEVINTNDNAPTFVPGSPVAYVNEGVSIGTEVVKFNATDKDGNRLAFSITLGNIAGAFLINNETGLLTTHIKLDREKIDRYNLTVTVTESSSVQGSAQSSSQNLSVIITDTNDNPPVFQPSHYSRNITENSPKGVLLTVKATDKDLGDNAKIVFTLDSISQRWFSVDSSTGKISSIVSLDHEDRATHAVTVTARDSGTPTLQATTLVKVTVNDINDNRPRFAKDYSTALLENTAINSTVLHVQAFDPDSGINGKIFYKIASGNDLGYFKIDKSSGIIAVAKLPDREKHSMFTLNVSAGNQPKYALSTPPSRSNCLVSIVILDANDNVPTITNNVSDAQIEENSEKEKFVLRVVGNDNDIGVNGEIRYDIVAGNIKNAFKIDRYTGVITTRFSLDREIIARYVLSVRVMDKGNPRLSSTKDFVVNVSDVDDNAPVFKEDVYYASVLESASVNTSIQHLQATDKDYGINSEISYSIVSGNEKRHLRIDPKSGEIFTQSQLDYETLNTYNLTVEARDTKHVTSVSVVVRVINVNDNRPVFNPASYSINIPENYTVDKTIFGVSATDKDSFGGLTYSLDNHHDIFTIDPSNGHISAISKLDRETVAYYNITIRATDGGTPSLTDTAVVELRITDVNDNSPILNATQNKVYIAENSEVGSVLLIITATDKDIGVNAELRYSIENGNEAGKFQMDALTGVLSVKGGIDREKVDQFSLKIMVRDLGTPSQASTPLMISVKVLDVNDNRPLFVKNTYEQNITENLSSGVFVQQVEAVDADLGLNSRVTYAIVSGAQGYFAINNESGIIETSGPLDREHIAKFVIVIEAKDCGNPSLNSTISLLVNVLDANDNSPQLETIVANVTEEKPKGEFVVRVSATDLDLGKSGKIEYSLSIQANQYLSIDNETGVVRTKVKFDYEQQKNHTFKIIATDKGKPPLSTMADFIIKVIDIDDNCPVFNPKEYNVTIPENLPDRTYILQVFATDLDTVGRRLKYTIRSGNIQTTFRMNASDGVLQSSHNVDREIAAEYNLVVQAGKDFCGVKASEDLAESDYFEYSKSIAKVNIILTDLNDNAPIFHQSFYQYELEDVSASTLLNVTASDPDEGINADFDFGYGGVTRNGSSRTLTVTATDKGTPPMTSSTAVKIIGRECEAMQFSVSPRGLVTAKTLCYFDQIVVPKKLLSVNQLFSIALRKVTRFQSIDGIGKVFLLLIGQRVANIG